jgi:hypothetical protein
VLGEQSRGLLDPPGPGVNPASCHEVNLSHVT